MPTLMAEGNLRRSVLHSEIERDEGETWRSVAWRHRVDRAATRAAVGAEGGGTGRDETSQNVRKLAASCGDERDFGNRRSPVRVWPSAQDSFEKSRVLAVTEPTLPGLCSSCAGTGGGHRAASPRSVRSMTASASKTTCGTSCTSRTSMHTYPDGAHAAAGTRAGRCVGGARRDRAG